MKGGLRFSSVYTSSFQTEKRMLLEETFGLRVIQNLLKKGRSQDSSVGIVTRLRAEQPKDRG